MVIKQKVKFQKVIDGKKHNVTVEISGRTKEELRGRVEKQVNRFLFDGYTLR